MDQLAVKLREARETSWAHLGRKITFFLPGMFSYNGLRGFYPAVSITGTQCALQCDHCKAKILEPMPSATKPTALVEKCKALADKGCLGILISGGCDAYGRLPWKKFFPAIRKIKNDTGLYISIHCGLLDKDTALALKDAGVDQALLDVIGDNETYQAIYHVPFGISAILDTMEALNHASLPMVPHVICGLYYGQMRSESEALKMISHFDIEQLVIVALMAIRGTPAGRAKGPTAEEVAHIIIKARELMPWVRTSFGCARERGNEQMELYAIDAGVNRMALPSDAAIERAMDYGLDIRYQRTCCSVSADFSKKTW